MLSFRYRLLAWSSFVGMFLVLLAGALVTKTGSGRGCGDDWPLCNGKFVPAYTVESFIEYSHRFVTGIVGIIVVLTFWYTWRYLRQHREAADPLPVRGVGDCIRASRRSGGPASSAGRIAYPCSPRLPEPASRFELRHRYGPRACDRTDYERRTAYGDDRRRECLFICQPAA